MKQWRPTYSALVQCLFRHCSFVEHEIALEVFTLASTQNNS